MFWICSLRPYASLGAIRTDDDDMQSSKGCAILVFFSLH